MSIDIPPLGRRELQLTAEIIKSARINMDPLAADRFTAHWAGLISRGSRGFDMERFLKCCGVRPAKKDSGA